LSTEYELHRFLFRKTF